MPKHILLTWENPDGDILTAKCWILSDDSQVPIIIIKETCEGDAIGLFMEDSVIFDDCSAVSGRPQDNVIKIEEIKLDDKMIFPHKCITDGCERTVELDDEPWCFTHSPDSGSSLPGYSARRAAEEAKQVESGEVRHNIFEQE